MKIHRFLAGIGWFGLLVFVKFVGFFAFGRGDFGGFLGFLIGGIGLFFEAF